MNRYEGRRTIMQTVGFELGRGVLNRIMPPPVQEALATMAPPVRERLGNKPLTMIVAHGLYGQGYTPGAAEASIMPYLDDLASDLGASASFPDLPGSGNPIASEWLAVLAQNLEKAYTRGDNISLVGYSLGSRAVMLLLREIIRNQKLQKYAERIRHVALLSPHSDEDLSYRYPKMSNYKTFFAPEAGGAISEAERKRIIQNFSYLMQIICTQNDGVVDPSLSQKLKIQYGVINERMLVLPTGGHMEPNAGPAVSAFLQAKLAGLAQETASIQWTNGSVY